MIIILTAVYYCYNIITVFLSLFLLCLFLSLSFSCKLMLLKWPKSWSCLRRKMNRKRCYYSCGIRYGIRCDRCCSRATTSAGDFFLVVWTFDPVARARATTAAGNSYSSSNKDGDQGSGKPSAVLRLLLLLLLLLWLRLPVRDSVWSRGVR